MSFGRYVKQETLSNLVEENAKLFRRPYQLQSTWSNNHWRFRQKFSSLTSCEVNDGEQPLMKHTTTPQFSCFRISLQSLWKSISQLKISYTISWYLQGLRQMKQNLFFLLIIDGNCMTLNQNSINFLIVTYPTSALSRFKFSLPNMEVNGRTDY